MMQGAFEVPAWLDVSRETFEKLSALCALVVRWTPAINLVAKSTASQIWDRHLLDSAQIISLLPPSATHWADLGSGGGFPGLVVSVLAAETAPDLKVTLVESDRRKCVFLSEAARTLGLKVNILTQRIDEIPALSADVLSARALASLDTLCGFADRHLAADGTAIFLKGANHAEEITEARKRWTFDAKIHQSRTDSTAVVLEMKAIRHV
jgi:16S rRNA (guanine527-N7)-methyltransferase